MAARPKVRSIMQLKEGEYRWSDAAVGAAVSALTAARTAPAGAARRLPSIRLRGMRIHRIDEHTCIEHILSQLAAGRGGFVVTPNLDHLRRSQQDVSFSVLVEEANLVVADGMPLVWASRLQGTPLPQRVAGSDLISSLSAAAAGQGRSIFLLGGEDGTATAAAKVLRGRYPQLIIAGTLCPAMGFETDEAAMREITATLQAVRPDIVYVALGSPKQERLIERIRGALPKTWWLGVGVSFSFLCGDVKRAPLWMRNWGLEWVHRLAQEPKRLFKRYVITGIPFAGILLFQSMLRGIRNRLMPRRAEGEASAAEGEASALEAEIAGYEDEPETLARGNAVFGASSADTVESVNEIATRLEAARAKSADSEVESSHFHEPVPVVATGRGRLRGLVLLGGGVRPTPLAMSLSRNVLDLPVGKGKTVLTRWLDEAAIVAQMLGMEQLPVRLLLDREATEPVSAGTIVWDQYRLERDTAEYRGTGGLLANIAVEYDDDDTILVGNAAQILLDPLSALLMSLKKTRGVVSLIGHRDGEPSGLMLITCRALRLIPRVGFVDMKEQALPIIASSYDVRVVQCRRPTGLSIRTLSDYIAALRALHQPIRATATDPWAEDWKSTFAIVEPGAAVSPSARIHDSVVLAGASVEAGAVVVRSVIAGTVRRDRNAVDQCVERTGKRGFEVVFPGTRA
ncbi:MAG: WecB/TagA/CpsF family glycosyltransferase [Tepidisphaeraceae bacterium]|jgi:N-acetylglucosaminyldiphosphoundecaprenol N-acetyl-beta-D-mannosaminyltransferase